MWLTLSFCVVKDDRTGQGSHASFSRNNFNSSSLLLRQKHTLRVQIIGLKLDQTFNVLLLQNQGKKLTYKYPDKHVKKSEPIINN